MQSELTRLLSTRNRKQVLTLLLWAEILLLQSKPVPSYQTTFIEYRSYPLTNLNNAGLYSNAAQSQINSNNSHRKIYRSSHIIAALNSTVSDLKKFPSRT
jgi:hypothetical protein